MILMGTGSRSLVLADPALRDAVDRWLLDRLAFHRPSLVVSGMAEGFDEALARAAVALKIPFLAAVPHPTYGQYYWGRKSLTGRDRLAEFDALCRQAAGVEIGSQTLYVNGVHANFVRNAQMVAMSDMALVYDAGSSGTRHAVEALRKAGKPMEVFVGH